MDIVIIGGGASAMILASKFKKHKVIIIEKNNKLGKKLLLTGNGKCNFTNDNFNELDKIFNNEFAIKTYKKYDNNSFIKFMSEIGIESIKEKHKNLICYYPRNKKSISVYYNLIDRILYNNHIIKCNLDVKEIKRENNRFEINTNNEKIYADYLIIATGGASYKKTGSDGIIFNEIKKMGHNIIKILPALTNLRFENKKINSFSGIRINAKVNCIVNNEKIDYNEIGEIQFNENNISGIPIMNLSRIINRNIDNGDKIKLVLDFCYEYKENELYDLLVDRRNNIFYKKAKDFLVGFLPDEISEFVFEKFNINKLQYVKNISNENLQKISNTLKEFYIDINNFGNFDNAQLTIGGVDVNEINENDLQSKLIQNLYFIGEVIDIDACCGGYNLQMAYSTASVVANALENI